MWEKEGGYYILIESVVMRLFIREILYGKYYVLKF